MERVGVAMLSMANRVEQLRQAALARVRENELEEALPMYDEALALCEDEEARELITINKADAMIGLSRAGAEVQELARVILPRPNPRHVCLAAYALQYKNRLESDFKRALFYGQLALDAAEEAGDLAYKRAVLIDLGNVYEMDSQIGKAIECFSQALDHADGADEITQRLIRGYATENLGYCRLLEGNIDQGISLIHGALQWIEDPLGRAEAYIDLCYGYLESSDLERARFYGEAGLEVATEDRQIRNAHYLLGEVAYKSGDSEGAERHFDELARFYPDFRNLKSLLYAIDLRSMVNLKL
jgi:tetratricopeptide (TPR) repeat protein